MTTPKAKSRRTTRAKLSSFAANLLEEWRRLDLPISETRIVVAVSGGADSSALLLGLDELIKKERLHLKLIVAHLDHGLRKESPKDCEWVSRLTKELGYDFVTSRANLKKSAGKRNLEQAA